MEIEKLKQELLKEAKTLSDDFDSYCHHPNCSNCELRYEKTDCIETMFFICLCDGYALGSNNKTIRLEIDKMIKELMPNFYEHLTKKEIE